MPSEEVVIDMTDPNQIIIISATTIMTVLLTIIGVQLVFVLRDLRKLLTRANNIMDEFEKIGSGLSQGYSEVTAFVSGIGKLLQVVDLVTKSKKKDKHDR